MLVHDWPIPDNVGIMMTNRHGGVSCPPYQSLNLGLHVGDVPADVIANRTLITQVLPSEPVWLEQVHGVQVINLVTYGNALTPPHSTPIADASYSNLAGQVCAVMTADCLPVLLCNQAGTEVAAAHAGWRGLCDGIIEATVAIFASAPDTLTAYLGPAIGASKFEVGTEVRQAFVARHALAARCFTPYNGKFLADIVALARLRLHLLGVKKIYSAGICTVLDTNYFSYRRDHVTGRMASMIWLKS